jgi:hypothetical protein
VGLETCLATSTSKFLQFIVGEYSTFNTLFSEKVIGHDE